MAGGKVNLKEQARAKHMQRHIELHMQLDELVADYLDHHRTKLPSTTTVLELMLWSAEQINKPTENPEEVE